jgi:hypothetical protein
MIIIALKQLFFNRAIILFLNGSSKQIFMPNYYREVKKASFDRFKVKWCDMPDIGGDLWRMIAMQGCQQSLTKNAVSL